MVLFLYRKCELEHENYLGSRRVRKLLSLGCFLESVPQILNSGNSDHTESHSVYSCLSQTGSRTGSLSCFKGMTERARLFSDGGQQQSPTVIVSNLTSSGPRARKILKV